MNQKGEVRGVAEVRVSFRKRLREAGEPAFRAGRFIGDKRSGDFRLLFFFFDGVRREGFSVVIKWR